MAISNKQIEVLNDKQTVVIIPADGPEAKLAQQFLAMNAPKVVEEQRMFQELHLLALQAAIKVVYVYRNPSTPVQQQFVRPDGLMGAVDRPIKELMDEMIVSKPLEPTFTREHPLKPPILNISSFLEETGKAFTHGLRLDFVDKGMPRPQVLRMSWT